MEQYPIPQFIEAEGKIAFFISFRQFFYLVGAGAASFFLFLTLPLPLFIVFSVPIVVGAAIFAFITIDGMPLLNVLLGTIGFIFRPKNYVWTKKENPYPFKPIRSTQIHKIDDTPVLQIQSSQLKKIKTKIETSSK